MTFIMSSQFRKAQAAVVPVPGSSVGLLIEATVGSSVVTASVALASVTLAVVSEPDSLPLGLVGLTVVGFWPVSLSSPKPQPVANTPPSKVDNTRIRAGRGSMALIPVWSCSTEITRARFLSSGELRFMIHPALFACQRWDCTPALVSGRLSSCADRGHVAKSTVTKLGWWAAREWQRAHARCADP
jgi:hypothetical protein